LIFIDRFPHPRFFFLEIYKSSQRFRPPRFSLTSHLPPIIFSPDPHFFSRRSPSSFPKSPPTPLDSLRRSQNSPSVLSVQLNDFSPFLTLAPNHLFPSPPKSPPPSPFCGLSDGPPTSVTPSLSETFCYSLLALFPSFFHRVRELNLNIHPFISPSLDFFYSRLYAAACSATP